MKGKKDYVRSEDRTRALKRGPELKSGALDRSATLTDVDPSFKRLCKIDTDWVLKFNLLTQLIKMYSDIYIGL